MKRSAPSTPFDDRPYVQQPVSCQFCRSRKLKCDRSRPSCFNCRSRNKDCIYGADRGLAPTPAVSVPSLIGESPRPIGDNLDLAERVARLERAVFSRRESNINPRQPASTSTHPAEDTNFRPVNHDEEQQKTSQWLEGLLAEDAPGASSTLASMNMDTGNIIRDFPVFDDATTLLDQYIQSVDATYRILHRPTAWTMLDALYHDLNAGHKPSATQLAFFLCIFSGSVYASKYDFQFQSPSLHGHPRQALAEIWAQQAVQLLTDRPVPPSVPVLQTIVSLAHLCTQMEGLRKNFNVLSAYGIQMARVMKLHRLDSHPSREERRKNGADMVDVEVKRRIWWHMAASDWLMSYNSGPNEGTYLLHPQQMETDHPSNVEDTDIPQGITFLREESYGLPLIKPTSMSYFIHRIQFATLAREVVDSLPVSFFSSPALESCVELYEKVQVMNQKYKRFIESLPPFFQLTIEDETAHAALIREMPPLEWQRYLIHFVLHTQLARLHRPFLIRGSRQPEYSESRLQCIQSAETVVYIRNRIMENHSVGSFTFVLQHFLNAAIILAMDACFNPDKVHAPRRKQEVLRACRALEHDLNAKLVPANGAPDEDISSGQAMVQSFQNAVRNLRSTLKNHIREDDTDNTNSSAQDKSALVLPGIPRQRRMATRSKSSMSKSNVGNLPPSQPFTGTGGYGNAADKMPVIGEEAADMDTPPDVVLDKLWDDLFSVGPAFNDADWDVFFSDLGATMG